MVLKYFFIFYLLNYSTNSDKRGRYKFSNVREAFILKINFRRGHYNILIVVVVALLNVSRTCRSGSSCSDKDIWKIKSLTGSE